MTPCGSDDDANVHVAASAPADSDPMLADVNVMAPSITLSDRSVMLAHVAVVLFVFGGQVQDVHYQPHPNRGHPQRRHRRREHAAGSAAQ